MFGIELFLSLKKWALKTRTGQLLDINSRSLFGNLLGALVRNQKKKKIDKIEGVLLLAFGGLGDLIFLDEIIKRLDKNIKIKILAPEQFCEIAKYMWSDVDFIPYKKTNYINKIRHIAGKNYLYISVNPTIESYISFILSGCEYLVGYVANYKWIQANYTKSQRLNSSVNQRLRISELVKFIQLYEPKLIADKKNTPANNQVKKKCIILSFYKSDDWSGPGDLGVDLQETLIRSLLDRYCEYRLLVIGTKGQGYKGAEVIEKITNERVINLYGKTSLTEAANLIQHSSLVVAVEGGVLHLASQLNVPAVGLYSFTNPRDFQPKNTVAIKSQIECSPCLEVKNKSNNNYPIICNKKYLCKDLYSSIQILESIDKIINE
jgi:ADP-heptose:LPS heptosyltransferase